MWIHLSRAYFAVQVESHLAAGSGDKKIDLRAHVSGQTKRAKPYQFCLHSAETGVTIDDDMCAGKQGGRCGDNVAQRILKGKRTVSECHKNDARRVSECLKSCAQNSTRRAAQAPTWYCSVEPRSDGVGRRAVHASTRMCGRSLTPS